MTSEPDNRSDRKSVDAETGQVTYKQRTDWTPRDHYRHLRTGEVPVDPASLPADDPRRLDVKDLSVEQHFNRLREDR